MLLSPDYFPNRRDLGGVPPFPFRLGLVPSLYGQIGQHFLMQFLTAFRSSGAQSLHFSLMGRRTVLGPW
jgi:hypothetical protein